MSPSENALSRRGLLGAAVGTAAAGGVAAGAAPAVPDRRGRTREYWIQADSFERNLVPNGYDGMMGNSFTPDQTSFHAVGFRAYSDHWGKVLPASDDIGPNAGIPGPVIRGEVGDTIVIHFKNNDAFYKFPHSMHPHGVEYDNLSDGAWLAVTPDKPGAAVEYGETYTYTWRVKPDSVGSWPYHDHSMPQDLAPFYPQHTAAKTPGSDTMGSMGTGSMDAASMDAGSMGMGGGSAVMEVGAELGLLGLIAITDRSTPKADREFFLFFHDLYQSDVPSLAQDMDCFNGYAYIDNTPTFRARTGQRVRWRVAALGKEFHVFHLHGHRWWDGVKWTDSQIIGPSTAITVEYTEDNPGDWLYHCHVTDHMMGGMVGRYVAEK